MKKSPQSINLQALIPIENYNVILNERSRTRQSTIIQTINTAKIVSPMNIRRKSCYCNCCGLMNSFQYNLMNIPFKKAFLTSKPESRQQAKAEAPLLPPLRRSIFYRKQSLKTAESDPLKLSLEIHGFDNKLKRQSTLQKLISETNERQKRGSVNYSVTNSILCENETHSLRSLQFNLESRASTEQSPILTPSPRIEIGSPKIAQARKINKMNIYFSSSQKHLKNRSQFCPIKKPPQLILPNIKLQNSE